MTAPTDQGPLRRSPQDHRAGDDRRPLRSYSAPGGRRDVDQAERMNVVRAFGWSLAGLLLGSMASAFGVAGQDWSIGTALLVTGGVWLGTFLTPLAVSALSGRAAAGLHNPSGRSTPRTREYSHAESLVARGLYEEGITAFELAIVEEASDPTPYLRIARVYRDRLERYDDSARWFKRALAESSMSGGARLLASRELVELYASKMGEPARAAPFLARVAEERGGTSEGEWAADELARVKTLMAEDEGI